MTTALVPFAPGFEEMEGVIIVDVCRRAGWTVDTVGLAPGLVKVVVPSWTALAPAMKNSRASSSVAMPPPGCSPRPND